MAVQLFIYFAMLIVFGVPIVDFWDDVKDKMKGFIKKVNNPFSSSSSGKFKGQGRVIGFSSSSSSFTPAKSISTPRPLPSHSSNPISNPKPKPILMIV